MPACTRCGEPNPEHARFCLACGAKLASASATAREERKVVSVLFVDLVGFTSRSDAADPEDVRATLSPYHARVRDEVERFGGVVEKFVGDAVMAVFGAPTAHEDDAERAVRAGLRVLAVTAELGLDARAAVNTGEAVVALDARPERGEAVVAGDVVNTAARLQTAAEPRTLVVGELTYRTTAHRVVYAPLAPVEVKGKPGRVPLWRAVEPREAPGDEPTPLVGRAHELALLRETFARVVRERAVQLVTLVGEPGVGKTRLVRELLRSLGADGEPVDRHEGRCLPYGEGIVFWALGEIVKSTAGIRDSDAPATAAAKLAASVAAVVPESDERDWVAARLAPLVGGASGASADRAEAFAAWRDYLEALAARRPLVLVVEDAQWADQAMLAFLEHLLEWSLAVPLLVLCVARPELFERHPAWGGGRRNSSTVSLSPLSSEETARLLGELLSEAILPAETQSLLLERSGGNPLYAEQFVRMLTDRGILRRSGRALRVAPGTEIPVPETVQAVITARVDALGPERKRLLQDAAVVGKVFWPGALAALGPADEHDVVAGLVDLAHLGLVRPARTSSLEGQREFSFVHGLVREVAYGEIPRAERARRHRDAAAWAERTLGDRVADHAELLAHHCCEALAAARAARADRAELESLRVDALRFVSLAAKQAEALDVAAAGRFHDRALELATAAERPRLLLFAALNDSAAGRPARADARLSEVVALLREDGGDDETLLKALAHLSSLRVLSGDDTDELLAEGRRLAERLPNTAASAMFWTGIAGALMMAERSEECLEVSERALAEARASDAAIPMMASLQFRGISRVALGDLDGMADVREALARAIEQGPAVAAGVGYVNLANLVWWTEGAEAGAAVYEEAVGFCRRRGAEGSARWAESELLWVLFELGRWDEALGLAEPLVEWARSSSSTIQLLMTIPTQARILFERGSAARAGELCEAILPDVRKGSLPQVVAPTLTVAAGAAAARGDRARALALLAELEERTRGGGRSRAVEVAGVARAAAAAGDTSAAARIAADPYPPHARAEAQHVSALATLAEADGRTAAAAGLYRDAAARWRAFGGVFELAHALLGAGRCGDDAAALREARGLFAALGATPRVADVDAQLTAGAAVS